MYLIIRLSFYIYLLMFSNPLKMIKIDRNMSELWQFACKNVILILVHLFVLCELFINARKLITLTFKSAHLRLSLWLFWQHQILVSVLQSTTE
jgi:hypothetical protein